ncbi:unnamed protein product [Spodoptera littoralis]|uniref:Uncharacterized protein n=1 Tax=Spodoptera littoralis TaxID=7109 RepID=A0A9P0ICI4_SPOLI|nr:unnamed protein product [Spodoptera littoralis]CAH1644215.1 unnamed protein product [Spodoptera littoralis]
MLHHSSVTPVSGAVQHERFDGAMSRQLVRIVQQTPKLRHSAPRLGLSLTGLCSGMQYAFVSYATRCISCAGTPTRFIDHALDIIVSHLLTVSIDFLAFEASSTQRPHKATVE